MYQKNDLNLSGILCGAGGPFCGESGPVSVAKGGILLLAEIGILYLTIYRVGILKQSTGGKLARPDL